MKSLFLVIALLISFCSHAQKGNTPYYRALVEDRSFVRHGKNVWITFNKDGSIYANGKLAVPLATWRANYSKIEVLQNGIVTSHFKPVPCDNGLAMLCIEDPKGHVYSWSPESEPGEQ